MRLLLSTFAATLLLISHARPVAAKDDDGNTSPSTRKTELLIEFDDRPNERREWFYRQRSYPFEHVPAGVYADAAAHYLAYRDAPGTANGALPTAAWFEVGPAPMLNSIFGYGNVTGRISTIALHPSDPDIVLVGGSAGGIWRTEDATAAVPTWVPVGDGLPTLAIADIEFAPSDPSIIYAASGDDDISLWGMGMFKSIDGGVTWSRVDDGTVSTGIPNGTVLSKIVVNFADPDRITTVGRGQYTPGGAYSQVTVYVTADGGVTWSPGTLPGGGTSRLRELVGESGCPDNLWAVDYPNQAIIRSTDFGLTWRNIPANGLPNFTSNTKMAVHRPNCAAPGRVYASVYSSGSLAGDPTRYAGVYVSTDDGTNWALPGAVAGPSGGCLGQCGYDHEMVADPLDPNHVYLIGRDFWGSFDGGANWTGISVGFPDTGGYTGGRMHVDMHAVEVWGTGATATVWVGGDGGIWSYDVAADEFTNRVGNLATAELIDVAMHPETPNLAIGGLQDNGSIMYFGNVQWQAVLHGDGGYSGFVRNTSGAGNPYDGAFTTYVGAVGYHSIDRGQNWATFTDGASFGNERNEFYSPWIGTDNRVWHGAESLWYCDWPTPCNPFASLGPNLAAMTGSDYISKLSIHMSAPGTYGPFYAATAYNRGFLQSNDGITWQVRTGTLPNRYITRVVHNPAQPTEVLVTLSGFGTPHVFFSDDGGQTWQDRSGNLPNVPVNVIYLDPLAPSTIWIVGTDVGVYGTDDAGTTWNVVGTNLPAVLVSDIEAGADGLIYAATSGRSIWAIPCGATPPVLNAAPGGDNRIDLTWTGTNGTYAIERSVGDCAGPFTPLTSTTAPPFAFSDNTVSGGVPYGYRIRTQAACGAITSACVEATTTGNCTLAPVFAGGTSATSDNTATCGVTVDWVQGVTSCPLSPTLTYNIYRDTVPDFVPSATNRIASCLPGPSSYADTIGLTSGTTYYYVVRSEDSTTGNGGPCGGNEDSNSLAVSATPYGVGTMPTPGTWTDGGGDLTSLLSLNAPGAGNTGDLAWRIVSTANDPGANNTPGGAYAYRNAGPSAAATYGGDVCAALETPLLTVGATTTTLQYAERHQVEYGWDGVAIEYAVNGGAWISVPAPSNSVAAGCAATDATTDWGTLGCTFDPPINACGYPATTNVYNGPLSGGNNCNNFGTGGLTSYAPRCHPITGLTVGDTVQFRWRFTSDGGFELAGFYLDDVAVTNALLPNSCTSCTPTTVASVDNTLLMVRVADDPVSYWTAAAGATSYDIEIASARDFLPLDRVLNATDPMIGTPDPGAVPAAPTLLFYRVRGVDDCGTVGP